MKFDTIKTNAKRLYAGALGRWDDARTMYGCGPLAKGTTPSFDALLPFVLATEAERQEMRNFAKMYNEHFNQDGKDWLASAAYPNADKDKIRVAWNQVVLRAREAGLDLIDKWDVRRVGKLIELFPEAVPARMRNKPLTCYVADNENGDWMVEVQAS